MRSHPDRVATALAVAAIAALCGCSSGSEPSASSTAEPTSASTSSESETPAPGAREVSPGGVTTAIGAPAESTEEEYFQACRAAKVWMDEQGGDPKTQIEPYLESVQTSDSTGPGSFGTPWSQLSPGRQAAVIVAVQAAGDALCE